MNTIYMNGYYTLLNMVVLFQVFVVEHGHGVNKFETGRNPTVHNKSLYCVSN